MEEPLFPAGLTVSNVVTESVTLKSVAVSFECVTVAPVEAFVRLYELPVLIEASELRTYLYFFAKLALTSPTEMLFAFFQQASLSEESMQLRSRVA